MYESAPNNATPPPVALPTDYKFVAWIQMRDFIITETNWVFYGLLAQCISKPNEYVLAIRGTEDLTEWWDDLTSAVSVSLSGFGDVAYGFQRIYETLRVIQYAPAKMPGTGYAARSLESAGTFARQIAAAVHATLGGEAAPPSPAASIEVTGHSLGAALATLYVAENSQSTNFTTPLICTFASPRVGDFEFKSEFDNLGITSWRVVNELDVVPKLPFIGYFHVETEQPYNSGSSVDWTLACWHALNTYLHLIDPSQPLSPECSWPQNLAATSSLPSGRKSANAPLLQTEKNIVSSGTIAFERSLRLDETGDSGAILAYVMNGEPLPIHHGFPLRLIVPSWYAVASVKWLTDIELIEQPFVGHFQMEKYWYEWRRGSEDAREPVTRMQVRALITEPNQGSESEHGDVTIRGVAWSGVAPIERVEVNTGGTWHQANLIGEPSRRAWQRWELVTRINASGPAVLRARAMDCAGRVQPEHAEWNRLGYGNNSIHEVAIHVV